MMTKKQLLYLTIFVFLGNSYIYGENNWGVLSSGYDMKNVREVGRILDHAKSYAVFIEDHNKNRFVVKQVKRSEINRHRELMVARECLASYIGEAADLPINHVRPIPSDFHMPGRLLKDVAGTLHTFVPGIAGAKKVYLQQPWDAPGKKNGMSLEVLKNMALHSDLPKIVALDTFIGNAARRGGSLFYDSKTDRFFAIDLESAFNKNLAQLAVVLVQNLIKDGRVRFTRVELDGLALYAKTLQGFVKRHTVEELCGKLDEFLVQAKINIATSSSRARVVELCQLYKNIIAQSYQSTQELVDALNTLIAVKS